MPESNCPNLGKNNDKCPCEAQECPRHGVCCECIRAHVSRNSLPACGRHLGEK